MGKGSRGAYNQSTKLPFIPHAFQANVNVNCAQKMFVKGEGHQHAVTFRTMKEIVDSGTIGEIKAVWVRHFVG